MPNGTGNSRNFQISGKRDNLWRLSKIFEMSFQKRSVPFDFVPEFPEILVQWIAPFILNYSASDRLKACVKRDRVLIDRPVDNCNQRHLKPSRVTLFSRFS